MNIKNLDFYLKDGKFVKSCSPSGRRDKGNCPSNFFKLWQRWISFSLILWFLCMSDVRLKIRLVSMAGGGLFPGVGDEVVWTMLFSSLTIAFFVIGMIYNIYNLYAPRTAQPPQTSYNNEVCPICISPQTLAVQTNCGHRFCGSCIRSYLRNQPPESISYITGRISCPLCRQDINLMLQNFTQEEMQSQDLQEERERIESMAQRYNTRFGVGARGILNAIRDCPVLIRHMFSDFFTMGGVVWIFRLRIFLCFLFAALYFGSPVDFIPEAVFGIMGLLDDIFIFFLCTVYASVIYRQFIIHRGQDD